MFFANDENDANPKKIWPEEYHYNRHSYTHQYELNVLVIEKKCLYKLIKVLNEAIVFIVLYCKNLLTKHIQHIKNANILKGHPMG